MIYQYIRRCQIKKIIYPIGLLVFCAFLIWNLPLKNQLHPASYSLSDDLRDLAEEGYSYISLTADKLYDTGCDYEKNGRVAGHYYYSLENGTCQFFLLGLSPSGHKESLEQVSLTGKILYNTDMFERLVSHTAAALDWTEEGVRAQSSPYVITTLHYVTHLDILLYAFLAISIFFGAYGLISMLVYFFRPDKAATFSRLSRYEGSHGLNQVEDEMANRVFVQSGPFYITEHYMIALAGAETQILPLSSIVWLYRHSSFFKLFHHHLKPTYHLAFMDEYGKIYETSSKEKEDTTAVIRAIRKYRPDVLIGYTQENREEAKKRIKKNENSV